MDTLDLVILFCCAPGALVVVCSIIAFAKIIITAIIGYFKNDEESKTLIMPFLVSSGSAGIIGASLYYCLGMKELPLTAFIMAIMVPLYMILQHIETSKFEKEQEQKKNMHEEKELTKTDN